MKRGMAVCVGAALLVAAFLGGAATAAPERYLRKGGLLLFQPDTYVVLDGEKNALILPKDVRWEGAGRGELELAVIVKDRVVGSLRLPAGASPRDAALVWFSPDEAHFLRWWKPEAGYAKRFAPESKPDAGTP